MTQTYGGEERIVQGPKLNIAVALDSVSRKGGSSGKQRLPPRAPPGRPPLTTSRGRGGASGHHGFNFERRPNTPPLDRDSRPGGRLGTPLYEVRCRDSTLSAPRAPPLDRVSRPGGHLGSPWKKARCRGRRDGPRMARPFAGRRATKMARRPKPHSSFLVPWARLLEN